MENKMNNLIHVVLESCLVIVIVTLCFKFVLNFYFVYWILDTFVHVKDMMRGDRVHADGPLARHCPFPRIAGFWIDWSLMWCVGFRMVTIVHLENLRSSHYFSAISDGAPWQSFTDRRGLYDSLATSRLFYHILLCLRSLMKKLMIDGCSSVSTLHM